MRGGWMCWGQSWFLDECTAKRINEFIESNAAKKKTSMSLIPMKMLMGRLSFSPHNILVLQSHTWIVTLKTMSSCLSLIQTTPPSIRKEKSLSKVILWLFLPAGASDLHVRLWPLILGVSLTVCNMKQIEIEKSPLEIQYKYHFGIVTLSK